MGTILDRLYQILRITLILLIAIILIGSLYGLIKLSAHKQASMEEQVVSKETGQEAYFSGLGRIRTQTADPKPATVVVSIVFPYDKNDVAFTEELSTHIGQLRQTVVSYFSSLSLKTLKNLGEDDIKKTLLDRFNKLLRLGSIKTLFFNDYLIFE
ncbi:flagellar basal body-associated FliL family protein [Gracilinema caldarium]|uniref:flagellar basal body-associated FliL family protein n=1 Tax=Gracilinema caldarium TaxID=215591 RepID=UPI0026F234AF|nr:flagellar basal body-associated FliL family protein [Gracilinema caldarium]